MPSRNFGVALLLFDQKKVGGRPSSGYSIAMIFPITFIVHNQKSYNKSYQLSPYGVDKLQQWNERSVVDLTGTLNSTTCSLIAVWMQISGRSTVLHFVGLQGNFHNRNLDSVSLDLERYFNTTCTWMYRIVKDPRGLCLIEYLPIFINIYFLRIDLLKY